MQGKRILAVLCALALLAAGCSRPSPSVTELRILNWGYEDSRYTNLYQAVQAFNRRHPETPYALRVEKYQDNDWDAYQALCEARHSAGQLDLFATGHEYIGRLAAQDMILPMDDLLGQALFQQEYFQTIWPGISYAGQYWGMPIDIDVQMVFVHRDALRAAGYTARQIAALPQEVASGRFRMDDLMDVARAGVQAGGFSYGLLHRPKNGQYFYMLAQAYGALYPNADGTMCYDAERYAEMLSFYQSLTESGLLPETMTEMSWTQVNQAVIDGQAAVYFGACYSLYDMVVECGAVAQEVLDQYTALLFPAVREGGQPTTISHPMIYAVDSNTPYRDDIFEILSIAFADSHNMAAHCAGTYHLPASTAVTQDAVFRNNTFLVDNMYMLDHTTFLPNHPDTRAQMDRLFADVAAAERGTQTPAALAQAAASAFAP